VNPQEEHRLDTVIGNLLRAGVVLSAAVVLFGGALYLARHGFEYLSYKTFRGEPADLRRITRVVHDVLAFRARGIIQLGLLLLIATPVARVAFSVWAFARVGDGRYAVITLIVLGLLFFSIFGMH
jgi:uncharacterized membrane protein